MENRYLCIMLFKRSITANKVIAERSRKNEEVRAYTHGKDKDTHRVIQESQRAVLQWKRS